MKGSLEGFRGGAPGFFSSSLRLQIRHDRKQRVKLKSKNNKRKKCIEQNLKKHKNPDYGLKVTLTTLNSKPIFYHARTSVKCRGRTNCLGIQEETTFFHTAVRAPLLRRICLYRTYSCYNPGGGHFQLARHGFNITTD